MSKQKEFTTKLSNVQTELKAPKGQYNSFGKYKYRSCEDILEALKPVLKKHGMFVTLSDEVVEVGGRVYVKATCAVGDGEVEVHTTAYAREEENKKGMDGSQITGTASSYARKYALNGMFCIDDTKDSDSTNTHNKQPEPEKKKEPTKTDKFKQTMEWLNGQDNKAEAWKKIEAKAKKEFTAAQYNKLVAIGKLAEGIGA